MNLTVCGVLDAAADESPETIFIATRERRMSFEEFRGATLRAAGGFHRLGIQRGDAVVILMGNSVEFVITWMALNRLGAVAVPMNIGLREAQLYHQLSVAQPQGIVADESSLDMLLSWPDLVSVVVTVVQGDRGASSWTLLSDVLESRPIAHETQTQPSDPAMVLFTSGTTGPSKGCVLTNSYLVRQGDLLASYLRLENSDVLYCPFPLFHVDAVSYTIMPAMILRTTAAIGSRFSTSRFWDDIRHFDATVFDFMGATLSMLYNAPSSGKDRDNPARMAWGVPVPGFAPEFEKRFGLRVVELYGSTDAGIPIIQPLDQPRRPGSCGRAIDEYDVEIHDMEGNRLPAGETGEIVIRPQRPHLMSEGYLGMPDATVNSRRNLWFHSGDLATQDDEGYFYFVGRSSDVIRRRGENISAHEIEELVRSYPGITECAAYGVPSPLTEDDVMLVFTTSDDSTVQIEDLVAFCASLMPAWMVPRYFEQLDVLPLTPTEKVEKASLKSRGVTESTWDREQVSTRHP